jgi:hypothetical protein
MKWREARCPGNDFEFERLVEILEDQVNRTVDPLQVDVGRVTRFFLCFSQDL